MSNKIEIYSAQYDPAGRVSFSFSRVRNTKNTGYRAKIHAADNLPTGSSEFDLYDIAAVSGIVGVVLRDNVQHTLQMVAINDAGTVDSSTSSDPYVITRK